MAKQVEMVFELVNDKCKSEVEGLVRTVKEMQAEIDSLTLRLEKAEQNTRAQSDLKKH
jgi:hypothetical protein